MASTLTQAFRSRIAASKRFKRDLVPDWNVSRDFRRGKPFQEASDSDRISVNIDAPFTKAKHASLFSAVPQVVVTEKHRQYGPAAPIFGKALNETLKKARIAVAMDECLPDMINMAGVAGVIVSYEALEEPAQVPAIDPALLPPQAQAAIMSGAVRIPMLDTKRTTDSRIKIDHVEPEDLLWPAEFKGSDFNDAPWVGRTGRGTWEAMKRTYGLSDAVKQKVVGPETAIGEGSDDADKRAQEDTEVVTFDEIYYWRHIYHEDEKSYTAIQRMVFINGIDEPVVNEPWVGQKYDEGIRGYRGSCLPPVQFCTLTHISGEAVPPSDSAISRPQVEEMNKTRTQMMLQRQHSRPIRGADVNRIDSDTLQLLQRGDWQPIIPINGDPERAIREVAKAQYPQEDFAFDRVHKTDLENQWGLGANQMGNFASGERSASEAAIIQSNNQTRIGMERTRVAHFLLRIAEVVGGLLTLYGEFDLESELGQTLGQDGLQRLQQAWDRMRVNHDIAFSIRPDSTVLLDTEQRSQQLLRAINYLSKMPGSNTQPLVAEYLTLQNIDPATVIGPPPPPPPQEVPALSLKGEDLLNPIALATLIRFGCAPGPKELAAAVEMLKAASGLPGGDMPGGAPAPAALGAASLPADNLPTSEPPTAPPEDPNPGWQMADRLNQRREGQV